MNIALVEDGTPVLGIVYAPAQALLFAGRPGAAFRAIRAPGAAVDAQDWMPITCRQVPEGPIIGGQPLPRRPRLRTPLIGRYQVAERIPAGSALKFGLLAEGKVDLYPRLGTVMEWDSAAGHALVAAAGGSVTRPDGSPLTYGHADASYKVHGFIAWGASGRPARAPPINAPITRDHHGDCDATARDKRRRAFARSTLVDIAVQLHVLMNGEKPRKGPLCAVHASAMA